MGSDDGASKNRDSDTSSYGTNWVGIQSLLTSMQSESAGLAANLLGRRRGGAPE